MTTGRATFPVATRRQLGTAALLVLLLLAGYAVILRITGSIAWPSAIWQAAACVLAAGPILLGVIGGLSLPKKLARHSRAAYRAASPLMATYQYGLPWLAWAALIWWMNGGRLSPSAALQAAAVLAIFSYASGVGLMLALRPTARDIEITRTEIPVANLPSSFDGYEILHISDIHAGARLSRANVEERLRRAAGLHPDLVVFTGDLAARRACVEPAAAALAGLEAHDGIVAVLGNHDHWIGEERVSRALSDRGVTVLANSHLQLARHGDALWIVGVKDCSYVKRDDLPRALERVPQDAAAVIITHSPDLICQQESARAAVMLAGHTHGGQMVFPWIGPLYVPTHLGRHRMSGLLTVDGRRLFISRGLGEVAPPMRLNCPPELAVITLRRQTNAV